MLLYNYEKHKIIFKERVSNHDLHSTGFLDNGNIWVGTKQGELLELDKKTFELSTIRDDLGIIINFTSDKRLAVSYTSDISAIGAFHDYILHYLNSNDKSVRIATSKADPGSNYDDVYPSRIVFSRDLNFAMVLSYISGQSPQFVRYNINTVELTHIEYLNIRIPNASPFNQAFSKVFVKGSRLSTVDLMDLNSFDISNVTPLISTNLFSFFENDPNQLIHSFTISQPYNRSNRIATNIWSLDEVIITDSFNEEVLIYDPSDFNNDGTYFSTVLNVWDTSNWVKLYEFDLEEDGSTNDMTFSPNNKYLALAKDRIWILDADTAEVNSILDGHPVGTISIDFSRNSNQIVSCGHDGLVIRWSIDGNNKEVLYQHEFNQLQFVRYINNDTEILHVGENGETNILNIDTFEIDRVINSEYHGNSKRAVALSEDDKYLFIGNQIWDVITGEKLAEFGVDWIKIESIKVSPDNKWFATKHEDTTVRVWELAKVLQEETSVGQFETY